MISGNYSLSLPKHTDAPLLLDLLTRNKLRLVDYFPTTLESIKDIVSARTFIKKKISQAKKKENFSFIITDGKKEIVGMIFIKNMDWRIPKAELAYFIDKDHEGKGIATEAMSTIVNYCFSDLKMNKLFLRVAPANKGSQRVAEKNKFKREGTMRKDFRTTNGKLIDLYYYGLVRGK